MSGTDWNRQEVEATVDDYLSMLASELAGVPYNKSAHRRQLMSKLDGRSEASIEFKHRNISQVLLDANHPYIPGYRPLANYQALLAEVIDQRLRHDRRLHDIVVADADRPIVVPEVDDILAILTERPAGKPERPRFEDVAPPLRLTTNYVEREARNQSLGAAGEEFAMNYERARLIHAGKEGLAARIEHTSRVRGDGAGYDILSFDDNGKERFIEVKTTKYGLDTPFFVSQNEVTVSARHQTQYHLYRLFDFRAAPGLYLLPGAISASCALSANSYVAFPR